jgi:hypothetical protein
MTNPYESPKTPSESNESPRITGQAAGQFLAGLFLCALITLAVAGIAAMVAAAIDGGQYRAVAALVVFMNAPGVAGPICGGVLWAIARKRSRPFAIGAVVTGVAAFLFVGGCLLVMIP